MIIVMQREASEAHIEAVVKRVREHGLDVNISRGTERTLIGAIGDERKLDQEQME
ncbi:MAG TPA: 3-deoxy-7-phosphoheptulonate synthase, partial [Methylophilaceae bacterium]|nr:3-deoxy-7-phosphoheptulonate synthase [Methylophilaceae bacterium]